MNIRYFFILPLLLSSCDFNEDFCIRDGELIAFPRFKEEHETPPPYERRFMSAYGNTSETLQTAFTQDTLRWKIPQGKYKFIFHTGNYIVGNKDDYYESRLIAHTDTVDGIVKIAEPQIACYTSLFDSELKYQQPVTEIFTPQLFTQRLNIKLKLSGNIKPLAAISGEISGAATEKYLVSQNRSGCADIALQFKEINNSDSIWTASINTFGFNPAVPNIFKIKCEMVPEDTVFNETQKIDLTPYLKDFNEPELSLEMRIRIGKEIVISEPIPILNWEDYPHGSFI